MNISEFEAIKVLVESTLFISFLVGLFFAYILFSLIDSIRSLAKVKNCLY